MDDNDKSGQENTTYGLHLPIQEQRRAERNQQRRRPDKFLLERDTLLLDEEDEVEDELTPKSEPSDHKSSRDHSRESSHHSFDEKSEEGSNSGYETDQGLQDELDLPVEEPVQPLRRSSRVPKPVIRYENAYGNKPATQIEKEISTEKGWLKAVGPSSKFVSKQVHNTFKEDLKQLLKDGGNKAIHYLLAQVVEMDKNPRDYHLWFVSLEWEKERNVFIVDS